MPNPVPQGHYQIAKRFGDLIFTSGVTPRRDGVMTGPNRVDASQPLEHYRGAVVLAAANALAAVRTQLNEGEFIADIVSMNIFIATEPDFLAHSRVADFASSYLFSELGERGIGARAAIGVASLPGGACVEIALVAAHARRV